MIRLGAISLQITYGAIYIFHIIIIIIVMRLRSREQSAAFEVRVNTEYFGYNLVSVYVCVVNCKH